MSFAFPYAFLLFIPLCVYLYLALFAGRKRKSIPFSSVLFFGKKPEETFRTRTLFIPPLLFLLSLCLGILALAGPQKVSEAIERPKEGIAIELVMDRSSSMETVILESLPPRKRIDSAKDAVKAFVFGDKEDKLSGRPNDMIGLITFARYADTIYPLSVSHTALGSVIDAVETPMGQSESEDGTNIGDALALASARLQAACDEESGYRAVSKVIILLTDGENNIGERTPEEAADLAAEWGIRVYCVFLGGRGYIDYYGQKFPVMSHSAGYNDLVRIAEKTGGRAFRAGNADELLAVYREIDTLEKTPFEISSLAVKEDRYRPFLLMSVLFLFASVILSQTIYRRSV